MFDFSPSQHEALKDRLVGVSGSQEKTIHQSDLKYVLLNLHCPDENFSFPDEVLASLPDNKTYYDYIKAEQDSGIKELADSILQKNNGGIALTVKPPRGVVDTIWYDSKSSVRNILQGEEADIAKLILMTMHGKILRLFRKFFNNLNAGTRVISLHSMEPYNTPNQPKPLTPGNVREYTDAYKTRPINNETKRENNLIVGPPGETPLADMQMVETLEDVFSNNGIKSARNKPYFLDPQLVDWDCYGSAAKMGNSGLIIDILKTQLCKGEGFDRSFDTTNPIADQDKVENFARIFSEALRMVLR